MKKNYSIPLTIEVELHGERLCDDMKPTSGGNKKDNTWGTPPARR